jgi:hypothetical protein
MIIDILIMIALLHSFPMESFMFVVYVTRPLPFELIVMFCQAMFPKLFFSILPISTDSCAEAEA